MPAGKAGRLQVEIALRQGSIEEVKGLEAGPPHLSRLVERTVRLLERGRFALDRRASETGYEVLVVSAVITDGQAPDPDLDDTDHVMELGSEGPTRERPGRAYFTLGSGRGVVVTIEVVSGRL